jgi:thiol:disulfide interchange protein DsbC
VIAPTGLAKEDPAFAKIRDALHERFPEVKVEAVSAAPVQGLYEVVTANEIVYTDASADHLIAGRIVDTHSRADLTSQRWDALHAIDFSSLPLDLAIKTVRGNGSRQLAIFEDPYCPYCGQLERDTRDLTDVTIFRFLFPIESLHPGSTDTAHKIWCSADRSDTWSKWMLERVAPPQAVDACKDDPISQIASLAGRLKVSGTPTIFLSSGRRVFGTSTTAQLAQLLDAR